MKTKINEVTGNVDVTFSAKLLSISPDMLVNVNDKGYRPCSLEFKDKNGKTQKASGIMYEKNFEHGVEIGQNYLATAAKTSQGVLITVSHLAGSIDRPTEDMFNFNQETISETSKAIESTLK